MRVFVFVLILGIAGIGCKSAKPEAPASAQEGDDKMEEVMMENGIHATVRFIELEGGFYGIESDAGDSYLPINLAEEYKEDGLRIVFTMKSRPDIMTTKMWGKTIEITEIQKQ
ncbi:MAG: hypothetical protein AAF564_06525 [Bacteroidota bacterium]